MAKVLSVDKARPALGSLVDEVVAIRRASCNHKARREGGGACGL